MISSIILLSLGLGRSISALAAATNISSCFDPSNYATVDVLYCDIAVIGGGSSGTYAAINLRELGQRVIVVEKENVLGGHTNTYTDAATGLTVDYGVQAYLDSPVTRDWFAHFDVGLEAYAVSDSSYLPVDFTTGQVVTTFSGATDLGPWAEQLAKYPWLDYTSEVPRPIAEDLLLTFGDFVTKYNLSTSAYDIYLSAQGLSDPLAHTTFDVLKMVDPAFLAELEGASLQTVNQDNSELYVKALAELGSDALLSSTVAAALRPDSGNVSLVVNTPTGTRLVVASKLLVTIPPILENMSPFGLSTTESKIFSQFAYMGYYTILLNNTGLPTGYTWINANASVATYNIPELPALTQIFATRVPGLFFAWYRSPGDLTQEEVEADTIATIQTLQVAEGITATTVPDVVEFRSHTPYKLTVPAESLAGGFYSDLYALQGLRSTWYTGAAFISHNSGVLWNFTSALLPEIVAA